MIEKNKSFWESEAAEYSKFNHSPKLLDPVINNPAKAFHSVVWHELNKLFPSFCGKKVCVPSSGDNHAVFAFAIMGAIVTSCDISYNQLNNAKRIANKYGWGQQISFVQADTMKLKGIEDESFDLVYTSNGVHVWLNDLNSMYKNVYRILKPNGIYIMYDIHPFLRPFNSTLEVVKSYDTTGPFETAKEVTFSWRIMDIMNSITSSGLAIKHIEELSEDRKYEWPYWLTYEQIAKGATATKEEYDKMYDWHNNPMAALPNWLSIVAARPD